MRKYPFIMVAIICLLAVPMAAVEADWHTELVDSNGGYWQTRVAVDLENPTDEPVTGQAVRLVVGADAGQLPLANSTTKSLRVVNGDGLEYLYRIEAPGEIKDVLSSGDTFLFAVDVPAKSKATYFVYADNTESTTVTEYLDETAMNWDQVENKFVPMNQHKTPIAEGLQVQVHAPERLKIESRLGSDEWNPLSTGDWRVRAEIRAVFLSPPKKGQATVIAYVARPVHMLRRLAGGSLSTAQARVIDPERKTELPSVWAGDRIF
ncbi:MAG: hypothetical protein ACLQVL_08075, partial [Terriglobia bacterium]